MTERIGIHGAACGALRRAGPLDLARAGRRWAAVAIAAAALGAAIVLWGPLAGAARWLMLLALVVSLAAGARAWATIIRTCQIMGEDHDQRTL